MDIYNQIGPEKPDYHDDVRAVRRLLRAGLPVRVAFAHRMTRSVLFLVPTASVERYGRAREHEQGYTLVAREGGRAYLFGPDPHPTYVAEKLGEREVDAEGIAGLLSLVLEPNESRFEAKLARLAEQYAGGGIEQFQAEDR